MDATTSPPPTRETALRLPVVTWLDAVLPAAVVVDELDGGYGVADLVGAAAPRLTHRRDHPVHEAIQLLLLDFLAEPRLEAELREWAPMGWRHLSERGLRPLLKCGVVGQDESGRFVAAWSEFDPFERMIAVELKLRDWRRAVAQAFRYRLFADAAYVAMPERYANVAVEGAARAGIGVLSVIGGVAHEILEPESASLIAPSARRLARERVLSALIAPSERPAGSPRGR